MCIARTERKSSMCRPAAAGTAADAGTARRSAGEHRRADARVVSASRQASRKNLVFDDILEKNRVLAHTEWAQAAILFIAARTPWPAAAGRRSSASARQWRSFDAFDTGKRSWGRADLFPWNRGAWIGMGKRAVFAANIGAICKKTNAVDLSSQVIMNRAE